MNMPIRNRLMLAALIAAILSASAFALHLAAIDNQALTQKHAARYTLCQEIRQLKLSLTAIINDTPLQFQTEAAREAVRALAPPTESDCVRFADLADTNLEPR